MAATTGGTGAQLQTKAALDFEDEDEYMVTVTASDVNGGTASIDVTITVTNANDAPVFPSETATRSIPENTEEDVNIGAPVAATDQDSGDTLMYTLSGADEASFTIEAGTGQLKTGATLLDYEATPTKTIYTVTVTATDDPGGATAEITVTINLTNVNEAPTAAALTDTRTIAENTDPGTNIGAAVTATDPDGDDLTYTLGGTDAASFDIESTSNGGQLKTKTGVNLDYEARTDYEVTVTATDPNGRSVTITVTITVTDVNTANGDTNDGTCSTGVQRWSQHHSPSTRKRRANDGHR